VEQAAALLRQVRQRHPDNFWVNQELAKTLYDLRPPPVEEAIRCYTAAAALRPRSPCVRLNLGVALFDKGQLDEAIAEYHEAIRLNKNFALAHNGLGAALAVKGQLDEAIAEYQEALRIKKDFAEAHHHLGTALAGKGHLDEAIAECREAIRIKKDFAEAHVDLGTILGVKGQLDEAIAECGEGIRIKKDDPGAHYNLGRVLSHKGQLDEAIAEYREAIRLKKDFAIAHNNLGFNLREKGCLDEAIAEFREAIRLQEDFAMARNNLHQAEQWVQLDKRLPDILQGKDQPKDVAERVAFAELCQLYPKQYAAAARFYGEAFAAEPKRADDLDAQPRYNAACAAALAGCGQGQDAAGLDEKERTRLRRQSLDWLRADLEAWGRLLAKEPDKARPVAAGALQHWLEDPDFAGVRGPEALAKLPEAERQPWQKLWADVADTLARAQPRTAPDKKPDPK
jgi:tetratricopeptide (TPR) repeat protein